MAEDKQTNVDKHSTLRFATLEDIPELLRLGRLAFQDLPEVFKMDVEKSKVLIEKFIVAGAQEDYLLLLSYDGDKVVGAIGAYAFEPMFSSQKIATECFWYLEEDYRGSRRALEMLEAYEYWAKLVGCVAVQYGMFTQGVDLSGVYNKIGAGLVEKIFIKDLK